MNDNDQKSSDYEMPHVSWYRHKLLHLVIISTAVALLLVMIAMGLYVSNGTEQLDISRPGYSAVQDQVDQSGAFVSFSAEGPVNSTVIDQFIKLFNEQTSRVDSSEIFLSTAISDEALEIDAP
jgi:hypothetical protein